MFWLNSFLRKLLLPPRGAKGFLLLFLLVFTACRAPKALTDPIIGPSYVPQNIYTRQPSLPPVMKRVVALPISFPEQAVLGVSGREQLEEVFQKELVKAGRFEVAFLQPAQLQQWLGKERFNTQDQLPPDFFKVLHERTGCDGVFFLRLTTYHAYPPLVTGWRARLVSAPDGETFWSADEVFDASANNVSNAARRFAQAQVKANPVLEDSRSILLSPSKFGQYTLNAIFSTIPAR